MKDYITLKDIRFKDGPGFIAKNTIIKCDPNIKLGSKGDMLMGSFEGCNFAINISAVQRIVKG